MADPTLVTDTTAWRIQVWLAFVISLGAMFGGIVLIPADMWIRGYLLLGLFFVVGSTLSLAKTVRDNQEAQAMDKRLRAAKTHRLLKEFELDDAQGKT